MRIKFIQNMIDKIRNKQGKIHHKIYGSIYLPWYEQNAIISNLKPKIYNQSGLPMDLFFIRDKHFAHNPYGCAHSKVENKYFLWDRFNFSLDTHFYTGESILETMGRPSKKIAWILEPRSICEKPYKILEKNKILSSEFQYIITHDEKLLNQYPHAKMIYTMGVWCYTDINDPLQYTEDKFKIKNKNISMVVSGKQLTPLHIVRNTLADKVREIGGEMVDVFGAYVNRSICFKSESLDKYRYQIVVENEISTYYFTEKILDCFISMCIPIYIGATKIGDFFNLDGIIEISPNDIDRIEYVLKQCNEKDYEERLAAIKDNYYRALKYINRENHLYEQLFIG
ncbi:hypothetical protein A0M43_06615 [Campylobacter jejuni]|nr:MULTISPECIES: hypothetical protein [Campylobacter]EDO8476239.1 hypothetical protein [Campylobacter jejuni]EFC31051.1 hypothetical protein C1336_000250320 [Campylobacter jejuni subsp. jejuni 1336]KJD24043.1 hypothetical protein TM01_07405 [Campylobacter jejuni subsp. jejuni]OEW45305.1 hypothetical protein AJ888_08810 [Campylobacter sp. BCW_6467]OEX01046.1 hypothetical protein A0M43_06615 [Campylobacter jejuni]